MSKSLHDTPSAVGDVPKGIVNRRGSRGGRLHKSLDACSRRCIRKTVPPYSLRRDHDGTTKSFQPGGSWTMTIATKRRLLFAHYPRYRRKPLSSKPPEPGGGNQSTDNQAHMANTRQRPIPHQHCVRTPWAAEVSLLRGGDRHAGHPAPVVRVVRRRYREPVRAGPVACIARVLHTHLPRHKRRSKQRTT